ncbi:MAG: pyridoxal-phosphate dependent enzyme [Bacteroidia bacterium]|nr:pyridoxal-phosphate dependent enzyme [Bacteroidia bacterium]
MSEQSKFRTWLEVSCDPDRVPATRIHRLHPLRADMVQTWVKREDESGFVGSGTKQRKFASLIPWLQAQGIQAVAALGGERSNHLAALVPLLTEAGIQAEVFVRARVGDPAQGNTLLLRLALPPERIHRLDAAAWPQASATADAWLKTQPQPAYLIPEGGTCPPALAGAMTLATDIHRNEHRNSLAFDHIITDAGTGLTAAALILAAPLAGLSAHIHVMMAAGSPASFGEMLHQAGEWLFAATGISPRYAAYTLHEPPTARAFGSINQAVLAESRRLAREHGLYADPVYTAKLFLTARHLAPSLTGEVLIIHGGGGTGLLGFGEKLLATDPSAL